MSYLFQMEPVAALPELSVEPHSNIDAAGRLLDTAPLGLAASPGATAESGRFGSLVAEGLEDTNNRLNAAEAALQSLAVGGVGNLHTVMISMEGAKLSFQLVAQVRNHVLSAYQDVVKMQI